MSSERIEIDVQEPSLDVQGSGTFIVGVTLSGIFYQRPIYSQVTSYANFDEGYNIANDVYDYSSPANPLVKAELDMDAVNPFITLKENNAFGNTNRFTDSLGGQDYATTYIIDHLTGLAWENVLHNNASPDTWAGFLAEANALTSLTFSDWRMATLSEILTIFINHGNGTEGLNYAPFNQGSAADPWIATTAETSTTLKFTFLADNSLYSKVVETNATKRGFYCRTHYT